MIIHKKVFKSGSCDEIEVYERENLGDENPGEKEILKLIGKSRIVQTFDWEEQLCEELLPYIEDNNGKRSLNHPYLWRPNYHEAKNAFLNNQFALKKELLKELLDEGNYFMYVLEHGWPYRLRIFQTMEELLTDKEYWSLLRCIWIEAHDIKQDSKRWAEVLSCGRPNKHLFVGW
jgi:hypothetical protein